MYRTTYKLLLLIVTLFALLGCQERIESTLATASTATPTAVPATATPEPTSTIAPSATPTASPTATPAPSPTAEPEAESETVELTEDTYRHVDRGITWTRPDDTWHFRENIPAPAPEITPLIMLEEEGGRRTVLLSELELPEGMERMLTLQFEGDPQGVVEEMSRAMGVPAEEAEIVEVQKRPAVLVQLDFGPLVWTVFRPSGVLYIAANGFEGAEEVDTVLETLEFTDEPEATAEQPPFSELSPEEQKAVLVDAAEGQRELETREAVTFESMTRDQFRQRMEKNVEEEMVPEELAAEDRMLKLLGLIPEETDLVELSLDLYESQVVGFYDPEESTFFLVRNDETPELSLNDRVTFIHEYVHALQDQHFTLHEDEEEEEDDRSQDERKAWQALVEGDAQWATGLYILNNLDLDDINELVDASGEYDTETLERTPSFLQQSLVFPYTAGSTFVQSIFITSGWEGVNDVWDDPPVSTKQIMFPETYPDEEPVEVTLPDELAPALGPAWSEPIRNVWGAFALQAMLGEHELTEFAPREIARGWAGDQYLYLTNGEQGVFVMEIAWTGSDEAENGEVALEEWLALSDLSAGDGNRLTGEGRTAYLQQDDDRLRFAIAHDATALDTTLDQLGWE